MGDYKTLFLQLFDLLLVNTFFIYFLFSEFWCTSDTQIEKTNVVLSLVWFGPWNNF